MYLYNIDSFPQFSLIEYLQKLVSQKTGHQAGTSVQVQSLLSELAAAQKMQEKAIFDRSETQVRLRKTETNLERLKNQMSALIDIIQKFESHQILPSHYLSEHFKEIDPFQIYTDPDVLEVREQKSIQELQLQIQSLVEQLAETERELYRTQQQKSQQPQSPSPGFIHIEEKKFTDFETKLRTLVEAFKTMQTHYKSAAQKIETLEAHNKQLLEKQEQQAETNVLLQQQIAKLRNKIVALEANQSVHQREVELLNTQITFFEKQLEIERNQRIDQAQQTHRTMQNYEQKVNDLTQQQFQIQQQFITAQRQWNEEKQALQREIQTIKQSQRPPVDVDKIINETLKSLPPSEPNKPFSVQEYIENSTTTPVPPNNTPVEDMQVELDLSKVEVAILKAENAELKEKNKQSGNATDGMLDTITNLQKSVKKLESKNNQQDETIASQQEQIDEQEQRSNKQDQRISELEANMQVMMDFIKKQNSSDS